MRLPATTWTWLLWWCRGHDKHCDDQAEDGYSGREDCGKRREGDRLAEPHVALVELPAPVAGDPDHSSQHDRRNGDEQLGAVGSKANHFGGCQAAADQGEGRPHPGEEGALIGKGQAGVGLGAVVVRLPGASPRCPVHCANARASEMHAEMSVTTSALIPARLSNATRRNREGADQR